MENTLATLVAMPTISDDIIANQTAIDYLAEWFSSRGMHIKRHVFEGHPALVATVKPGVKHAKVMLYGHIDVMPGTEQVFTMRTEETKLIGRGVYDMKFAVAAYMHVIDEIQESLSDYGLSIVIVSDEEYGGRDGINSMKHLVQLGYKADVCVMPDGGKDWDIEATAKGYWRFDLIATGRTAHASRPWEGDSASFKLIQALHELRDAFKAHGPDTDTLNIGTIHGNGTYNQIPSEMSAAVEIRLSTDESLIKNDAFIEGLCKKYGLSTRTRVAAQPIRQDLTNPLVQEFFTAVEQVTGRRPKPCMSNAASDAAYLNEVGTPCILTYLPGGGHHGEHEWIDRQAFSQILPVMRDYIERTAHVL